MNGWIDRSSAPLASVESYSSMSTYLACPLRYRYRYVDRLPVEARPALFALGSAVHRAFEVFVRAKIASRIGAEPEPGLEVLQQAFDKALDGSGCTAEEIAQFRARGRPMLERFLAAECASASRPVGVEMGFGTDVAIADGTPVRFVGYIGRIDRRDGRVELIDYKSAPVRRQACVDGDLQLTAYAFALACGAVRDPESDIPLEPASRLGLWFVEDGVVVWTTRSEAQLGAFERLLTRVVTKIRRESFPPNPGPGSCRWCDYAAVCESNRGEVSRAASHDDPWRAAS